MTMQDPRAGVVRNEADRNVVRGGSDVHNVAADRVDVVILAGAGDAHDIEVVTMEMDWVRETTGQGDLYGAVPG